ncbi:MAG: precorrin-2 C(20)-methyltransferase [Pseudomonadota bacterium]
MTTSPPGRLYGVGVGPGDPELMTLKAARVVGDAPVVAFFAKKGAVGNARQIVEGHIAPTAEELRFEYPMTTELPPSDPRYKRALSAFYDDAAKTIGGRLDNGLDVAVLCEGDPFFYGSFMYMHDRLGTSFPTEVIAGVTGMSACWSRAGTPMTRRSEALSVLSGTLDNERLRARLAEADAAVIMKVGRNLRKIRSALADTGLLDRAIFVERGSMDRERIERLCDKADDDAPYFSLVLVPGRSGR